MTNYDETNANNDSNNDSDNDSENMTDDQYKSESIATSERLFDTDYYATLERNNTYYITAPYEINGTYLKDLHISSREFFKNSYQSVQNYICEYTISSNISDRPLEIVKTSYINLPGGFTMANVIIKTFWIKIVQRRWRNVLQNRKRIIHQLIVEREYTIGVKIPQLRGCLRELKLQDCKNKM